MSTPFAPREGVEGRPTIDGPQDRSTRERHVALHRVNYVVREVPNYDETRAFYREFGLTEGEPGTFSTQVGGEQLYLKPAQRPRVTAIGVGADARSDLDDTADRLAVAGF